VAEPDRARVAAVERALVRSLGADVVERHRQEGRALPLREACALGQAVAAGRVDSDPASDPTVTLTRRERQVAALVASGLANRQMAVGLAISAGLIADRFVISRPAVSRHLRVLREAGLVRDTADGRRRVYTLVVAALDELAGWLGRLMRPSGWQHRLDALEIEVYGTRRERHTAAGPHQSQKKTA
jgi:DNA-binding transcriptional ArsR family regulator